MQDKRVIKHKGKTYTVMIFSVDGELYWRVTKYGVRTDTIAKELQEVCNFPISKFGFTDFGVIDKTAYWESRTKSTVKEQ